MESLSFLTPTIEYRADYESRFETPIDIGTDSAYDAVMMLTQPIRKAASPDKSLVFREFAKVEG